MRWIKPLKTAIGFVKIWNVGNSLVRKSKFLILWSPFLVFIQSEAKCFTKEYFIVQQQCEGITILLIVFMRNQNIAMDHQPYFDFQSQPGLIHIRAYILSIRSWYGITSFAVNKKTFIHVCIIVHVYGIFSSTAIHSSPDIFKSIAFKSEEKTNCIQAQTFQPVLSRIFQLFHLGYACSLFCLTEHIY